MQKMTLANSYRIKRQVTITRIYIFYAQSFNYIIGFLDRKQLWNFFLAMYINITQIYLVSS